MPAQSTCFSMSFAANSPRSSFDLPRGATPIQRVVLAAATQRRCASASCSLAGLRDTIRMQTMMREQAPQVRLWLVESGATAGRALLGKSDFEKGDRQVARFRHLLRCEIRGRGSQFRPTAAVAVPPQPDRARVPSTRRKFPCRSGAARREAQIVCSVMVTRFKRSESEDALDARIAVLSARLFRGERGPCLPPAPVPVPEVEPAIGSPGEGPPAGGKGAADRPAERGSSARTQKSPQRSETRQGR